MTIIKRLLTIKKGLQKHEITRKNLQFPLLIYYQKVWQQEVLRKILLKWHYRNTGLVSTNLETKSNCNRQCEFCFNHPRFDQRMQGEMSFEMWKKIIDELADLKFTGRLSPHFYNEPLLDKRLAEFLTYARKKLPLVRIQINTNGDLLNEKKFFELIKCGVNFFFVTNYDETDKPLLNKLAKLYPAMLQVVKNSDMWRTDRGGDIFGKEKVLSSACLRPSSQLVVNWAGEVLLCCMDFYAVTSFGNLENNKFMDIWQSSKFCQIRENIKQNRQKGLPICHNCDDPGNIPW